MATVVVAVLVTLCIFCAYILMACPLGAVATVAIVVALAAVAVEMVITAVAMASEVHVSLCSW